MKGKDIQPRMLYPPRLSFRIEIEIKSYPEEKKLKKFNTTKPVLQCQRDFFKKKRLKIQTRKYRKEKSLTDKGKHNKSSGSQL